MSAEFNAKVYRGLNIFEITSIIVVVAVMSALTYSAFTPLYGFDDANIVQTYAVNIANGHGFSYNVGGERVEGFTSLIWTCFNALLFMITDKAESILFVVSFAMTLAILILSAKIAKSVIATSGILPDLTSGIGSYAGVLFALIFVFYPSFFVYHVWSLMDTTLWTLVIIVALFCTLVLLGEEKPESRGARRGFVAAVAIMGIVRPEGMGLSLIFIAGLGVAGWFTGARHLYRVCLHALIGYILVIASVLTFRYSYFGYPVPNTFYAKISSGLVAQMIEGGKYFIKYVLSSPISTLLVLFLAFLSVFFYECRKGPDWKRRIAPIAFIAYVVLVLLSVYIVLGGDNFAKFRFYLPLGPVLIACAAAVLIRPIDRLVTISPRYTGLAGCLGVGVLLLAASQFFHFDDTKGGMEQDFLIAEKGRVAGELLSELPGTPTLGVVAAGGVSRTFDGHIYDLMGLNWVEMAHAVDDLTGTIRNHGSFDRTVFFKYEPTIVIPELRSCRNLGEWPVWFFVAALKDLPSDPEFQADYVSACYKDVVMYVRRDYAAANPGVFEWLGQKG